MRGGSTSWLLIDRRKAFLMCAKFPVSRGNSRESRLWERGNAPLNCGDGGDAEGLGGRGGPREVLLAWPTGGR